MKLNVYAVYTGYAVAFGVAILLGCILLLPVDQWAPGSTLLLALSFAAVLGFAAFVASMSGAENNTKEG